MRRTPSERNPEAGLGPRRELALASWPAKADDLEIRQLGTRLTYDAACLRRKDSPLGCVNMRAAFIAGVVALVVATGTSLAGFLLRGDRLKQELRIGFMAEQALVAMLERTGT